MYLYYLYIEEFSVRNSYRISTSNDYLCTIYLAIYALNEYSQSRTNYNTSWATKNIVNIQNGINDDAIPFLWEQTEQELSHTF